MSTFRRKPPYARHFSCPPATPWEKSGRRLRTAYCHRVSKALRRVFTRRRVRSLGQRPPGRSINQFHTVLLSEKAAAGEKFDILVETYAGHGKVIASYGPVNPGEQVLPPVPSQQRVFSEASIVIWDEESYQLCMDMLTLYDAAGAMDPNSMRRHRIEKALVDVTFIIDLEDNPSSFDESVRRAREFLAPALAAVNGSTALRCAVSGTLTSMSPGCGRSPRPSERRLRPSRQPQS